MKFDTNGLEAYMTDRALESEQGVWVKFPGGRAFRILRAGGSNQRFSRALQQAIKPYRRQMDKGTMDNELGDEIMRGLYARHIVKDWRGIKDEDGQAVECTPENIDAFLRAFPEVFNDLMTLASEMATFTAQMMQEAATELGEA